MAEKDKIEMMGKVIDIKPGVSVVEIENGHHVRCTLNGKLRMNKIKIMKGDSVKIEVSPYDLTKGRIVWRN